LLNHKRRAPNKTVIEFIENTIGIKFDHSDIGEEDKKLLEERASARSKQNWQESDHIREQLKDRGIGIGDSPLGQIWYRI
jgi:cysteinyl-tRNA synthetase